MNKNELWAFKYKVYLKKINLVGWRMDLVRKKSAFIMQEKFSIILQKWNSQMCFLLFFNNFSKSFNLLDQNIQFISHNINIK